MRYYAHFGFKDFVLALGYKGDVIKNYFVNYDETISNDFVYSHGGKDIELLTSDIDDWRITFVDTGMHSNVGSRLMQVREHLEGEEMFMANYADGLTDMDLGAMLTKFRSEPDMVASFMMYRPTATFHVVQSEPSGVVNSISPISKSKLSYNTGYFILRPEIFDHMECGEELVEEPFQRLIKDRRLLGYRHDGFWQAMDTFKDKMALDELEASGESPWEVWKQNGPKVKDLV